MFAAGTPRSQLSSCFLVTMAKDDLDGIYQCVIQCAKISKIAGSLGVIVRNIRAKGTQFKNNKNEKLPKELA